ncbi:hypothetical protein H2O64_04255 [Kordia sp. YSTF-M3]|uniref:Big-1 domain-containing protein n=1 Tax=Kordia aestuariivivens TaxID=2759037 RepID=A0ABR7Q5N1_9FLAO|nr:hypothetical protein [Kordia aestuariivivens]MBC8753869.1 hypothetical protein [Kordia aestuariivivens]
MKILSVLCLFFIFNITTTNIIGTYRIDSKTSFDTLELKFDGTYKYLSRGDSCWTWRDIKGKWELKNDILILHNQYSQLESATTYTEKVTDASRSIVLIDVKNNFRKPIIGFEVTYSFAGNKQTKKTDKNGIIAFENKLSIHNENESAMIQIEYTTNEGNHTENRAVEISSNSISISINSKPKTISKKENYTFSFRNGILKSIKSPHFQSKTYTYKKL